MGRRRKKVREHKKQVQLDKRIKNIKRKAKKANKKNAKKS